MVIIAVWLLGLAAQKSDGRKRREGGWAWTWGWDGEKMDVWMDLMDGWMDG